MEVGFIIEGKLFGNLRQGKVRRQKSLDKDFKGLQKIRRNINQGVMCNDFKRNWDIIIQYVNIKYKF